MKLYELGIIILIGGLVALATVGYLSQKWLGADNELEEHVEEVILDHTGLEMDLSPCSPEDPKKEPNKVEILKF